MSTKSIDGLAALAQAAPDAHIQLTVVEVQRLMANASQSPLPSARPYVPRGKRTATSKDAFRLILHLWPSANISKLSEALGVSREWIYRVLRTIINEPTAPDPEENGADESVTLAQWPDTIAGLTELLTNNTNP